jgi:peptidoglycan biosynthesis protein MviN/MurJ (putative lipid II flippase)
LLLIGTLGVAGISLATGLVGWMQVYLLHKKLGRKEELAFDERLRTVFPKIAICSCVMAIVLAGLNYGLQDYFHGALHIKISGIAGPYRGRRNHLRAGGSGQRSS